MTTNSCALRETLVFRSSTTAVGAPLARDERGIATMEFAFIAVVFAALIFGVTDVGQRIRDKQRLNSVATHLGDLITQEASLSEAKIDSLLASVKHYAGRQGFGAEGTVIVSGVAGQANGVRKVVWQRRGAGTLDETSRIGSIGGAAQLPADFVLAEGQTAVAVEVISRQQTILTKVGASASTSVRTAYLRGRKGELAGLSN